MLVVHFLPLLSPSRRVATSLLLAVLSSREAAVNRVRDCGASPRGCHRLLYTRKKKKVVKHTSRPFVRRRRSMSTTMGRSRAKGVAMAWNLTTRATENIRLSISIHLCPAISVALLLFPLAKLHLLQSSMLQRLRQRRIFLGSLSSRPVR